MKRLITLKKIKEVCKVGLSCMLGHKWNGCKCERCGKVRDEQHDWDLCKGKCKRCGKYGSVQHDWNGYKCVRCGAENEESIKKLDRYKIVPYIVSLIIDDSDGKFWYILNWEKERKKRYPNFCLDYLNDDHCIEIAKKAKNVYVAKEILKRIKDKSRLEEIAKHYQNNRTMKIFVAELCGDEDTAKNEKKKDFSENLEKFKSHFNTSDKQTIDRLSMDNIIKYCESGIITQQVLNQEMYNLCFIGPNQCGTNGSDSGIAVYSKMYEIFINYITDKTKLQDIIDKHPHRWAWRNCNPVADAAKRRLAEM
jgi:hypothetical protein